MPLGEFTNTYLSPFALGFMMFGMGLSLTVADFKRVADVPKPVFTGLVGQLVVLPALGFLVATVLPLAPALAVGLIVIASCPGGVSSNAIVFAVRADLALSITLTAVGSFVTVFSIPLLVTLAIELFMQGGDAPQLPVGRTMLRLFMITVLPVSLGMSVRRASITFADKTLKFFRPAGIVVIMSLVATAMYSGFDFIRANFAIAAPLAIGFTIAAIIMGYTAARIMDLPSEQTTTIAVEVGVQNIAVAIFITLALMNSRELAAVPVLYGVIGYINIFLFLGLLRWRRKRRAARATNPGGAM